MAARRLVGSIGWTDIDVGRCSKSDIHVDVWSAGLPSRLRNSRARCAVFTATP